VAFTSVLPTQEASQRHQLSTYSPSHLCHAGLDAASACNCFTLFINSSDVCFPLFALMQKGEQKNQGKPEPLRAFCRPTHSNTPHLLHYASTYNQAARNITEHNFFKSSWYDFPEVKPTIGAVSRFAVLKVYRCIKSTRDKAHHHSACVMDDVALITSAKLSFREWGETFVN